MNAPNFSLPDQEGILHSLSHYHGKWLVVYFYPKDDTPGCTKEACSFRDKLKEFEKRGVEIVGISKDSVTSHQKFSAKFHLTFPILADPDHSVTEAYGSWGEKHFMGRTYDGIFRNTFLINPLGEIVKKYEKVNPLVHASQILSDVDTLLD